MKKLTEKLYIAVVYNPNGSLRDNRSHQCWTGNNKKKVIEEAFQHKFKWERGGQNGPYQVVVGEITEQAMVPVQYRLIKIDPLSI